MLSYLTKPHCPNIFVRLITTSKVVSGRSRTNESAPIPGSLEQTDPLKWANRLYKLQALKDIDQGPPSPLNMVCKIKSRGIPYYLRCILEKYGLLHIKNFQFKILKNIPSVNEDLKKVAHLIKVVPVKFPNGVPKIQKDFMNAQLKPNGNLTLHTGIKTEGEIIDDQLNDEEMTEKVKSIIFSPSKNTERSLKSVDFYRTNMAAWRSNSFMQEFYTSHYQYEHNQDGKEYRYSKMWRFTDALKQSMDRRYNKDGTLRMNKNAEADWNTYPWRFY